MKRFVIVVDTQADFMRPDGALAVTGADALIAPMQAWLASLPPLETIGVLFTFDTHYADSYPGSAEAAQFPIHCVHGTPGWANVLDTGAVVPAIPVYTLEKGVFDMWAEPGIEIVSPATGEKMDRDAFFTTLKARGVAEVVVIGVAADYCVRWAIDGLVERGFAVEVPPALTRGIARPIEQVLADDFAGAPVHLMAAA
jgi:nicotinamidase/pyrazinamidase